MTSFFYVVSIAFHTSVLALRKCMDTSRKKVFWLRVQRLVHRVLHLFVGPERLFYKEDTALSILLRRHTLLFFLLQQRLASYKLKHKEIPSGLPIN